MCVPRNPFNRAQTARFKIPTFPTTTANHKSIVRHCREAALSGRLAPYVHAPPTHHSSCPQNQPRDNKTRMTRLCALPLPADHPNASLRRQVLCVGPAGAHRETCAMHPCACRCVGVIPRGPTAPQPHNCTHPAPDLRMALRAHLDRDRESAFLGVCLHDLPVAVRDRVGLDPVAHADVHDLGSARGGGCACA